MNTNTQTPQERMQVYWWATTYSHATDRAIIVKVNTSIAVLSSSLSQNATISTGNNDSRAFLLLPRSFYVFIDATVRDASTNSIYALCVAAQQKMLRFFVSFNWFLRCSLTLLFHLILFCNFSLSLSLSLVFNTRIFLCISFFFVAPQRIQFSFHIGISIEIHVYANDRLQKIGLCDDKNWLLSLSHSSPHWNECIFNASNRFHLESNSSFFFFSFNCSSLFNFFFSLEKIVEKIDRRLDYFDGNYCD